MFRMHAYARAMPHGCLLAAALVALGASPRQLPAADRLIEEGFEELFVIGREAGTDHELLFGLVDVAFAPDGELYVLEERNHRVLVFGPEGAFLRSFAREGQGPGEFQLPMTLAVTASDEVAVWDFQHRAYLLFDRQGEYVRNVGWADWGSGPSRNTLRPWPDGGVVYLPNLLHDDGDPEDEMDRGAILREPLGVAGGPEELLVVRQPKRRGVEVTGVLSLTNGPRFTPMARWDVLPDGRIAVVEGTDYRVRIVDPDSGASNEIRRAIAPRPVAEADRERERDKRRAQLENPAGGASFSGGGGGGGGAMTPGRIREIVAGMEFADVIPAIRELRVDGHGRLWIQRYGDTYDDPGPIDVVTADGGYLGTLPAMPMPDEFGSDGRVAWMQNGRDVDVERVIVRGVPASLR